MRRHLVTRDEAATQANVAWVVPSLANAVGAVDIRHRMAARRTGGSPGCAG